MPEDLRSKLSSEVMAANWNALVPQFARGALLLVEPALDLLDAAEAVAHDEQSQVASWLEGGLLRRASDDDARRFTALAATQRFQFVIVQPWVLAQELLQNR